MGKQDIGDLESVRRAVEEWMRSALPDRPGLNVGPLDFPEASGESSVTLIFETTRDDAPPEKFVLRMVPPQSQVFESHDLLMQYRMMEVMHAEGVPAPPLVGYEADPSLVGSDFYVMGFTDGRIPPDNPPMAFGSWVTDDLSAEDRATMWSNGLETLAKIHSIDLAAHDFSRLPRAEPGEPLVAHELRKFDSMYTDALRNDGPPEILDAWTYLVSTPPADGVQRLCWGDSRVGNVIWRDLRPVAVIDWEMANLGDPRSDLAWWIWIDKCNSEGLGCERPTGWPVPEEAYARWSELTGLPTGDMVWWELLTVARFAIVLELKFQAMKADNPDFGGIPNFAASFLADLLDAAR